MGTLLATWVCSEANRGVIFGVLSSSADTVPESEIHLTDARRNVRFGSEAAK
jgi:hypothetical protein